MSRMKHIRQESGFTLIELMIALVLTLVLIGGALLIHLSGRQASIDAERLTRMQEGIRFTSDYIIRDLRNAGFRDETTLKIGHESQIREKYATFGHSDGDTSTPPDELIIRYAGRGSCTETFQEFRLVENHYYLDGNNLMCNGRSVFQTATGDTQIESQTWSGGVALVSGVERLAFQKICPEDDSVTTCECNLITNPADSCVGTRVALMMEGPNALDDQSTTDDRTVELVAAFRNVILERIRNLALPSET